MPGRIQPQPRDRMRQQAAVAIRKALATPRPPAKSAGSAGFQPAGDGILPSRTSKGGAE